MTRRLAVAALLAALFVLGWLFGGRLLERGRGLVAKRAPATAAKSAPKSAPRPVTPKPAADAVSSAPTDANEPPPASGRVAIVIDDLGRQIEVARQLVELDSRLTFAVLPFEPHSREVAELVAGRGAELLLHLPMEPEGDSDPGPGALSHEMSASEIGAATRRALAAVPGVAGANNHMGSALTADRGTMRAVLAVLGERRLYFLDSRTSTESVGYEVAREAGVPAARRDLFLDETDERAAIAAAIDRLVDLALSRGAAIGIAHPRRETLAALAERLPRLRDQGIELVPASFLVDRNEELPE